MLGREDGEKEGEESDYGRKKKPNQCYQIRGLLFQLHLTLITSPKAQRPHTDTLGLNTHMAVDMNQIQFCLP